MAFFYKIYIKIDNFLYIFYNNILNFLYHIYTSTTTRPYFRHNIHMNNHPNSPSADNHIEENNQYKPDAFLDSPFFKNIETEIHKQNEFERRETTSEQGIKLLHKVQNKIHNISQGAKNVKVSSKEIEQGIHDIAISIFPKGKREIIIKNFYNGAKEAIKRRKFKTFDRIVERLEQKFEEFHSKKFQLHESFDTQFEASGFPRTIEDAQRVALHTIPVQSRIDIDNSTHQKEIRKIFGKYFERLQEPIITLNQINTQIEQLSESQSELDTLILDRGDIGQTADINADRNRLYEIRHQAAVEVADIFYTYTQEIKKYAEEQKKSSKNISQTRQETSKKVKTHLGETLEKNEDDEITDEDLRQYLFQLIGEQFIFQKHFSDADKQKIFDQFKHNWYTKARDLLTYTKKDKERIKDVINTPEPSQFPVDVSLESKIYELFPILEKIKWPDYLQHFTDKYTIHNQLGKGGYGEVYKVTVNTDSSQFVDEKGLQLTSVIRKKNGDVSFEETTIPTNENLALKVIPAGTSNLTDIERLIREGQLYQELSQKADSRLVPVYHVSSYADKDKNSIGASIVMKQLSGGRLSKVHIKNVDKQIGYFKDIAHAVSELHSETYTDKNGQEHVIEHRDIKPQNIFIEKGNAYLGDPGISNAVVEDKAQIGTLAYTDPLTIDIPHNTTNDIYSLGLTFYETLTGKHPYKNVIRPLLKEKSRWKSKEEKIEVIKRTILTCKIKSPKELNPNIPDDINNMIMRMLSFDQYQRPTAQELEQFLDNRSNKKTTDKEDDSANNDLFYAPVLYKQKNTDEANSVGIEAKIAIGDIPDDETYEELQKAFKTIKTQEQAEQFFAIFGISSDNINKAAYRKLTTKYHSDKTNSQKAHWLFNKIDDAYKIITKNRKIAEMLDKNTPTATHAHLIQSVLRTGIEGIALTEEERILLIEKYQNEIIAQLKKELGADIHTISSYDEFTQLLNKKFGNTKEFVQAKEQFCENIIMLVLGIFNPNSEVLDITQEVFKHYNIDLSLINIARYAHREAFKNNHIFDESITAIAQDLQKSVAIIESSLKEVYITNLHWQFIELELYKHNIQPSDMRMTLQKLFPNEVFAGAHAIEKRAQQLETAIGSNPVSEFLKAAANFLFNNEDSDNSDHQEDDDATE